MLKKFFYTWAVIREWKECGEFRGIRKVMVVDEYICVWIILFLLAREKVKVCYDDRNNFKRKYKKKKGVKWLVSKKSIKHMEQYGTDIIVLPISFSD